MKFVADVTDHRVEAVAPLVGARIEIEEEQEILTAYRSLPSWERGLKCIRTLHTKEKISHSPRGAWIEICRMQNCNDANITAHSGRGME